MMLALLELLFIIYTHMFCFKMHFPITDKTVTPEVHSVTCPHKSNGQSWISFKNNCYTLLLGSSRWGNNNVSEQQICKTLGTDGA